MTSKPHPFEIQEYYQNVPRVNEVFSRDNLPNNNSNNNNNNNNKENGAYVINLDECRDIGTHWVALYVNIKTTTYFDSFGVEHIPKEIMKFIRSKELGHVVDNEESSSAKARNKNIITNTYRIQA